MCLKTIPFANDHDDHHGSCLRSQGSWVKAEGVVIEHVEEGSVAQDAGLQKGDVILEVNRQKIRNEDDYLTAMEKAKPDQGVLFLVNRRGSMFFVSLKEGK